MVFIEQKSNTALLISSIESLFLCFSWILEVNCHPWLMGPSSICNPIALSLVPLLPLSHLLLWLSILLGLCDHIKLTWIIQDDLRISRPLIYLQKSCISSSRRTTSDIIEVCWVKVHNTNIYDGVSITLNVWRLQICFCKT